MTEESPTSMPRDFKGLWIPGKIWLDPDLSLLDKNMWAEINILDGDQGCDVNNQYFQEFFNVSESTIQSALKSLTERGYIEVHIFDGNKRVIRCKG